MRQWIRARADEEYLEAMDCVRAEEAVGSVAWRTFQSVNGGHAVLGVHTAEGDSLTTDHYPLSFHVDRRTVVAPVGDSLIDALTKIEPSEIVRQLQPYDPLSWFCVPSVDWHEWFCWMAADPRLRSIPRVRVIQPPPSTPQHQSPPIRPVTADADADVEDDDEDSDDGAEHRRRRYPHPPPPHPSSIVVTVDTLAWPTARRVTAPPQPPPPPPSHPPPRSVVRRKRGHPVRFSYRW